MMNYQVIKKVLPNGELLLRDRLFWVVWTLFAFLAMLAMSFILMDVKNGRGWGIDPLLQLSQGIYVVIVLGILFLPFLPMLSLRKNLMIILSLLICVYAILLGEGGVKGIYIGIYIYLTGLPGMIFHLLGIPQGPQTYQSDGWIFFGPLSKIFWAVCVIALVTLLTTVKKLPYAVLQTIFWTPVVAILAITVKVALLG